MSNNLFFFFNNKLKEDKIEEEKKCEYINLTKNNNDAPIFNGCVHYISAAARAINENFGLDYVVGASDFNTIRYKDKLEENFNSNDLPQISWTKDYNFLEKHEKVLEIIMQKIEEVCPFEKIGIVYILITSGSRNQVMFFSTFVQILKARGLKARMIHVENERPQKIIDITNENRYYDVLRGVELFTETGNPRKLKACYENNEQLSDLFKYMENFYESIQLCKPIQCGTESIVVIYKKMMDEIDKLMQQEDVDVTIKLMLPEMKIRFRPLPEDKDSFLQILQWCANNRLILEGYFILDAEFTEYLLNKGILSFKGNGYNGFPSKNELDALLKMEIINKRNEAHKRKELASYSCGSNPSIDTRIILRNFTSYTAPKRKNGSWTQLFWERDKNSQKQVFDNWFIRYDEESILKFFRILMLHEFIRKIRNNMAHSDIHSVIGNDYNVSLLYAADKVNEKVLIDHSAEADIFSPPNDNGSKTRYLVDYMQRDIIITDSNAYKKCLYIFEAILEIINDY
ncbi:MAG: TM1812 family CRISPR-associated protein [Ruminococcus flavefaciens]|nr:TM1812 family CRISPR-associated protein [Ruminococcus flavefaciens]MCM1361313.1 TM1812 family CRISPR-associated protein [Clostridiales bacterium]